MCRFCSWKCAGTSDSKRRTGSDLEEPKMSVASARLNRQYTTTTGLLDILRRKTLNLDFSRVSILSTTFAIFMWGGGELKDLRPARRNMVRQCGSESHNHPLPFFFSEHVHMPNATNISFIMLNSISDLDS